MFCLIIKLNKHLTIYFYILFVFYFHYSSVSLYISIHCIVYCSLCVYLVLCYLVLWPRNWINTTTTTTTTTESFSRLIISSTHHSHCLGWILSLSLMILAVLKNEVGLFGYGFLENKVSTASTLSGYTSANLCMPQNIAVCVSVSRYFV